MGRRGPGCGSLYVFGGYRVAAEDDRMEFLGALVTEI